jgi:16S rRNA (guanine527-N7)-methyltransferase
MTTTPGAALRRGTGQAHVLRRARGPLPTRVSATPALPPDFRTALERGADRIGLALTAAQVTAIEGHARLLLAWTDAVNLTSIRAPLDLARLHVLDSLSAVPILRDEGEGALLDLGSGGGYPGLPLAVVLGRRALLVDSVGKKARFLETAVTALALGRQIEVATARAESLARGSDRERWPVVTARAVAPLAELVELAFPLLMPGGRLVAWKRGDIAEELTAARRAVDAAGGGVLTVRDPGINELPGHLLVEIRKTGATPADLPRDPAVRRRRPW